MSLVEFEAMGKPQPQGSARAFVRGGRATITTDNPALHSWREVVGWAAQQAMKGRELIENEPLEVRAVFRLSRPMSAPKRRHMPIVKPDIDKLTRGLLDACTGVVWRDDALVCKVIVYKLYCAPGQQPGVTVTVEGLQ